MRRVIRVTDEHKHQGPPTRQLEALVARQLKSNHRDVRSLRLLNPYILCLIFVMDVWNSCKTSANLQIMYLAFKQYIISALCLCFHYPTLYYSKLVSLIYGAFPTYKLCQDLKYERPFAPFAIYGDERDKNRSQQAASKGRRWRQ